MTKYDKMEPTPNIVSRAMKLPTDAPVTVLILGKFRNDKPLEEIQASYEIWRNTALTQARNNGGFLIAEGNINFTFVGKENKWDIMAVARFPNASSFVNTLFNEESLDAIGFRRDALCESEIHFIDENSNSKNAHINFN